jgi:hypothetical protein
VKGLRKFKTPSPWKAGAIGSSFKPFWIGLRPIVFNNRDDDGATIHLAAPNARRKTTKRCAKHTFRRAVVVAVIKKQAAKLLQRIKNRTNRPCFQGV